MYAVRPLGTCITADSAAANPTTNNSTSRATGSGWGSVVLDPSWGSTVNCNARQATASVAISHGTP